MSHLSGPFFVALLAFGVAALLYLVVEVGALSMDVSMQSVMSDVPCHVMSCVAHVLCVMYDA